MIVDSIYFKFDGFHLCCFHIDGRNVWWVTMFSYVCNISKLLKITVILVVGNVATIGMASADLYGHRLSLTGGTLGLGAEYSFEALETLSLRANVQGGTWSYKAEAAEIGFDANLDLLTFGLQADFTPFGSGLYATAGMFYNKNTMTLKSTTEHKVQNAGNQYNMSVTSVSDVAFRNYAPYVGGGYKLGLLGIMDFYIEAGVMSQGTPTINTKLSQINDAPVNVGNNLTIPVKVANNISSNASTIVESFTIYPVIKIAGSIKF